MKRPMLEVTFRRGRPLAAYLRLDGSRSAVATTRELSPNLIGDFAEGGSLLGLEILAFDAATVGRINELLAAHGHAALEDRELAPLRAA